MKDLNSTNGTYVNGACIGVQERPLAVGDRLQLGEHETVWTLSCALSPVPRARKEGSDARIDGRSTLLALPSADSPMETVMLVDTNWVRESTHELVTNGDSLSVGGMRFVLELPAPGRDADSTLARNHGGISALSLQFVVSRDGEHIVIEPQFPGSPIEPLKNRAHNLLLLHLAEARIREEQQGVSLSEAGWIDIRLLQDLLNVDETTVNLHVYRARKAFDSCGIPEAARIVERRIGTGQIRLGSGRVVIRQQ